MSSSLPGPFMNAIRQKVVVLKQNIAICFIIVCLSSNTHRVGDPFPLANTCLIVAASRSGRYVRPIYWLLDVLNV